jgi:hypothetical protein
MKKREPKYVQELRKEMADRLRKHTIEYKKEQFRKALSKGNVETFDDVYGIWCGLSAAAKENAVYKVIIDFARRGITAREIVDSLEVKE